MQQLYWRHKVRIVFWGLYLVNVILVVAASVLLLKTMDYRDNPRLVLLWAAVLLFVLSITMVICRRFVFDPMNKLSRLFYMFSRGVIYKELFESRHMMDAQMQEALGKMEQMIDRNSVIDMAARQAEYLTLQNQINPHFLYNTLESIRAEAILSKEESIANMAEALGKFFRYTITRSEDLVTLEDELDSVNNYFKIQKYRFEDRVNLLIHSDEYEAVSHCQIPKLILQPLVENSIQHGLESKLGNGVVSVDIEHTRKNLFIYVRDNGIGISEDKIESLNKTFQDSDVQLNASTSAKKTGIALSNVNARIKLQFGSSYGLHIITISTGGVEVRVNLPYIETRQRSEAAEGEGRYES
ncbi:MAG: sensor histidine kinase [Lachnospiraceae bacterium]